METIPSGFVWLNPFSIPAPDCLDLVTGFLSAGYEQGQKAVIESALAEARITITRDRGHRPESDSSNGYPCFGNKRFQNW